MRRWRTAHASAAGTAHGRTGVPCQDAGGCVVVQAGDGTDILLACVADGAGSAAQSEHGANLVVAAFLRDYGPPAAADPGLGFLDLDHAQAWLAATQRAIADRAAADGFAPADYACTVLAAVVGPASAAFFQVGDGAIVVGDTADGFDGHGWIFWPQHGEFANSTYFVTMPDAATCLCFEKREAAIHEVALFTDGLERLILDMRARTVHSPSLQPILAWLATTDPGGHGASSPVLAAFLDSAPVNRRTDDDKTLVLATRAEPPP